MELFEATQTTDDPLDYIRDLTNLIRSADWTTFSPEKAICQFFLKGVKCEESKKVCVKFLQENPEGDSNQLIDQLKKIEKTKTICNTWMVP